MDTILCHHCVIIVAPMDVPTPSNTWSDLSSESQSSIFSKSFSGLSANFFYGYFSNLFPLYFPNTSLEFFPNLFSKYFSKISYDSFSTSLTLYPKYPLGVDPASSLDIDPFFSLASIINFIPFPHLDLAHNSSPNISLKYPLTLSLNSFSYFLSR